MATYQLRFVGTAEQVARVLDMQTAGDDAAIAVCLSHSIQSDMTVELWAGNILVTRATPMTARMLVNPDDRAA